MGTTEEGREKEDESKTCRKTGTETGSKYGFLLNLGSRFILCTFCIENITQRRVLHTVRNVIYSQTCLKRPLKGPKKWSLKTGGLITQVNHRGKCT